MVFLNQVRIKITSNNLSIDGKNVVTETERSGANMEQ